MSDSASSAPPPGAPSPARLVESMRARNDLRNARIADAFLHIPRAAFLPDLPPEWVYSDEAIPLKRAADGTVIASSSQPSMMALMLEQLRLNSGMNVLEIGAGTGYNAALIYHVVGSTGRVTSIELDPQLAEAAAGHLARLGLSAVKIVTGDGAAGFAPRASYDRIIATAGIWDVPLAWIKQLKPRGLLVAPLWIESAQYSATFELQPDGTLYSDENLPCGFVRLRGAAIGEEGLYRVGSSLVVQANAGAVDAAQLHLLLSQALDAEIAYVPRLSAGDISWRLSPYLALALPQGFALAAYSVPEGQRDYGLEGSGIALIGRGSACFVPAAGEGKVYSFGGSDAVIALQTTIAAWEDAGRPRSERLRLRLSPIAEAAGGPPANMVGRRFHRRDHVIDAWLEGVRV